MSKQKMGNQFPLPDRVVVATCLTTGKKRKAVDGEDWKPMDVQSDEDLLKLCCENQLNPLLRGDLAYHHPKEYNSDALAEQFWAEIWGLT
jgi:hypothetical protein